MSRRKTPRHAWLSAACVLIALMGVLYILLGGGGDDGALAAPAPLAVAPKDKVNEAGAPPAPTAESASKDDSGKDAGGPPKPIDLAVAPDGGVPIQPNATHFKSPFASPNGLPAKVKVGFLLNSVDGYDVKTGTFTADFFLSLTSATPMPPLNLQFPNGSVDKREEIADKPTFKLYRLSGSFKSPADLRKYPFDAQDLKIIVEDDERGTDQLDFVVDHDRTQVARGFRAVGWQVDYVEARVQSQSYPDRFENDDLFYSRYTFTLGVDRYATSAAFKVFVPAIVIVFISLLGMWVPAEEMEVRSNSGAPMLAGAVLFHFSLMQEVPATSYLTRADKLMLGVYIALILGMVSTWCMFLVKEHNVHKVFRIARVVVPVLSVTTMVLAVFA